MQPPASLAGGRFYFRRNCHSCPKANASPAFKTAQNTAAYQKKLCAATSQTVESPATESACDFYGST
jgi:hypothetical protein